MGTIDVAFNVDATALFFSRPKPDMSELITELNSHLSGYPDCHMQMSPLSHEDWWLLSCAQFHIMIAFAAAPSTDARLAPASKAPVCDLRRFDYVQAYDSHQAYLHIEVGDGNAPLPPEARTIMQEFGESKTCDPKLKMMALHWTSQFIMGHQGVLALHFGPSDRMFCPDEVKECAGQDFPTTLLKHPVPSLPVPGPTGADAYHVRLKNPQHLDGPAIALEGIPVSIPLRTAVTLLNTLYSARDKGKVTLSHGKVIKPSAKLALYAREEAARDDAPNGEVVLSFWKQMAVQAKAPAPAPVQSAPAPTPAQPALAPLQDTQAKDIPAPAKVEPEPKKPHLELVSSQPDTPATPLQMQEDPHALADSLMDKADAGMIAKPQMRVTQQEAEPDHDIEVPAGPHRKGPHMWLVNKLRRVPFDSRAKIAGLTIIVGLQVLWNPYGGFTGGLSATYNAVANLPSNAQQALLNE